MFLDTIRRRNPGLVTAAMSLHQQGTLPANTYVIDLDAVTANAEKMRTEADRVGLRLFAMTKQMGRNPDFIQAIQRGGIDEGVAVDMSGARAMARAGMAVAHLGHLVQIPRGDADEAAGLDPAFWTVFNEDKAAEAAQAAHRRGRIQPLLARVYSEGDRFYPGHEGGFAATDVVDVAHRLEQLGGATFAGVTTFPGATVRPRYKQRPTHR